MHVDPLREYSSEDMEKESLDGTYGMNQIRKAFRLFVRTHQPNIAR